MSYESQNAMFEQENEDSYMGNMYEDDNNNQEDNQEQN